jgi:hypothetical protein
MKVDKETVIDLWDLPYGENSEEGVTVISDRIRGIGRWSRLHELVVKIKGKFYSTNYSVAATELQDETPWQYQKEVTFTEVEPVEKTITVYVPVEKEAA